MAGKETSLAATKELPGQHTSISSSVKAQIRFFLGAKQINPSFMIIQHPFCSLGHLMSLLTFLVRNQQRHPSIQHGTSNDIPVSKRLR